MTAPRDTPDPFPRPPDDAPVCWLLGGPGGLRVVRAAALRGGADVPSRFQFADRCPDCGRPTGFYDERRCGRCEDKGQAQEL